MRALPILVLVLASFTHRGLAQPAILASEPNPTAETIMARVAANQDRSEAERSHYVYVQHARIQSRKGNTLMCEEITDSRVVPSPNGSHAILLKLSGRLLRKQKYVTYTTLPPAKTGAPPVDDNKGSLTIEIGDGSTDRTLVEDMRAGLTNDKSRDGVAAGLFPLTSKSQADYAFHLKNREKMNDRDVFHIEFSPKKKDDFGWKGDAYIDSESYEPVLVSTAMARKIPFAVRTFLGTNLPGLGFSVTYAPQPDGTWFPTSFGTEFKLNLLFFFHRQIVIDAHNQDFAKTHVTSELLPDGEAKPPL